MNATILRRRLIGSALVALVAAATATAQTPSQAGSGADEQVKNAQQQLAQAAMKGDKDQVGRYLADDVSWVGSNGQVMDKQAMLSSLPAPIRGVDADHLTITGKTAIVTGTAHLNSGKDSRFLQEWVNRDGQWKVLAHQGTVIGAAPPTAERPTATSGTTGAMGTEPRTVAPTLSSDDERAVWKAQEDIVNLYNKGDVDAYSRLTSDDFVRIDTDGKTLTKGQWLDNVRKNTSQQVKPGAVSDVKIRVDNDVAVATMQIVPFNKDGTTLPAERQTRIFEKRNGRWQQVAAISTLVAAQ